MQRKAIRGNLAFTPDRLSFDVRPHSWLLIEGERIVGIRDQLPNDFETAEILDYGDCLVIPGLIDLHTHAAQYAYRGLGMDKELLPWLETHAFPEESRFAQAAYAAQVYRQFAEDLGGRATTRAIVWGTIHTTTDILFDELARMGIGGWVGKLNMDRHTDPALTEDTDQSLRDTLDFIQRNNNRYPQLKPVITPRFIPSCTDELLTGLGQLSVSKQIPVTSHLSENKDEIAWVREVVPASQTYGDAYDRFSLLGQGGPCVMAHVVHLEPGDLELLRDCQVTVAHCPASNLNVMSGFAPIRQYLHAGVKVGLGTDVAGGYSMSIFDAMVDAIRVSKLHHQYIDPTADPLSVSEAFYLGTKGGGQVFGPVGSFETGCLADLVVIDDQPIGGGNCFPLQQRLERLVYLHAEADLIAKFLAGEKVPDVK